MQDSTDSAISVQDVSKRYRGRRGVLALKGVSLAVGRGEIFGLLGRNGAGKTSLVKILLDIVRPTQGNTSLLGVNSRKPRARLAVGYLPEDHRFPDYRTGEQTLEFYSALSGMSAADCRRRTPELLELVDLTSAARAKVRTFSKGMKQRLGLAQALVHDPQILFLDEPTDGVDPVGRAAIRDVLEKLKQAGKTIFLNSHLLGEVEQICDRVAILEQGQLVREGTVADLTRTDGTFELVTDPELDSATLEALAQVVSSVSVVDKVCEIRVVDEGDLDAVVDLLRARGLGLRRLAPRSSSLEQVFLQSLERNGGRAA